MVNVVHRRNLVEDNPGGNSGLPIIGVNGPIVEEIPNFRIVESQTFNNDNVKGESACLEGHDSGIIHRRAVKGIDVICCLIVTHCLVLPW